jgi:hypothetical protein
VGVFKGMSATFEAPAKGTALPQSFEGRRVAQRSTGHQNHEAHLLRATPGTPKLCGEEVGLHERWQCSVARPCASVLATTK